MSKKETVLLTGATSFSGCHIANKLSQDFDLVLPLLGSEYSGIKQQRLDLINGNAEYIYNCDISSDEFVQLVQDKKPDVFINHGGYITGYRTDDFDFLKHLETNLKNIKNIIKSLKENNCKLFIHSGSAFEPLEGLTQYGFAPYGVAKKMVWDMILFWCNKYNLPVCKIVIPNPYGYLENEDRLLPIFHNKITNGEQVKLVSASTIRNNIRGEELAEYYYQASIQIKPANIQIIHPQGYTETQEYFVKRALQEHPYNLSLDTIESNIEFVS